MEEDIIRDEVEKGEISFGIKSKKFSGALMVEVLKSHLEKVGFSVSNRDVFVRGVKAEIDLLVIRKEAVSQYSLIYDPNDVVAAFEVKRSGSHGEQEVYNLKDTFDRIKEKNSDIFCCYITLKERKNYKYKITSEKLGHEAYTLFSYEREGEGLKKNKGEWDKLLGKLKTFYPV